MLNDECLEAPTLQFYNACSLSCAHTNSLIKLGMLLAVKDIKHFRGSDTSEDSMKYLKDNQKNVQKSPHLPY